MGLFQRFSNKYIDDFAKELAREIAKKYPPEIESDSKKKISEKRVTRILEEIFRKAVNFKKDNKLGFYRKARLGNTFQWELTELGYSKEFITVATEGIIVYTTRGKN